MPIVYDTGWVTTRTERCYSLQNRKIQFDVNTPADEIYRFFAYEDTRAPGQVFTITRRGRFMYELFHECDSGD